MLVQDYSIKSLYPLALAEGEGVGTAYEYFVKRLRLRSWLRPEQQIKRILIAGLPEKYGASLDFMLLSSELSASLTIVDERPQALQKAAKSLNQAQASGYLSDLDPEFYPVDNLGSLVEFTDPFDLALSSETVQRLRESERIQLISRLLQLSRLVALFAPNNDNPAHTNLSGLSGLHMDELQHIVFQAMELRQIPQSEASISNGYIDMPPFPPGITRSEQQRQQATSGKGEAVAMWGLGHYAHLEDKIPLRWRRSRAHILFTLINHSRR
jgi:hypothetical protein